MADKDEQNVQWLTNLYPKMNDIYRINSEDIYDLIYPLSYIVLHFEDRDKAFNELLKICLYNNYIDMYQRRFLIEKCSRLAFRFNMQTKEAEQLILKAWVRNIDEFKNGLNYDFKFLYKANRNSNRVAIITSQLLSPQHSTSSLTFAACERIIEKMKMEVLLINSAEALCNAYNKPFHFDENAYYIEEYSAHDYIEHENNLYRFHQCKNIMPNKEEMCKVFDLISEYKPDFIINIGWHNATAELCSNIVPVITLPTLVNTLPHASTQFLMLRGRKLDDSDNIILSILGKDRLCVIDDTETSATLPKQKQTFSRQNFNLPEDRVLVALAGNRLNFDITDNVIMFFKSIVEFGVHIVLIGDFLYLDSIFENHPDLKNSISSIGYQDDFQAAIQICDIFINPDRQGNGMVGLLAMLKSVPIITFPNNDIANLLTEEFYVNSYEQMTCEVYKYLTDIEYYKKMSQKSYQCGHKYVESCDICDAINRMKKSPLFI